MSGSHRLGKWLILAGACIVGLAGLLLFVSEGPPAGVTEAPVARGQKLEEESANEYVVSQTPADRAPAGEDVLQGRVLWDDGDPASGILVTWTVLPEEADTPTDAWDTIDWDRVSVQTLDTRTDSRGLFFFDAYPLGSSSLGSALWFTGANCEARVEILEGTQDNSRNGINIALRHSTGISANVKDIQGHGVAGAKIEQIGVRSKASRVVSGADSAALRMAHRIFRRVTIADSNGHATLCGIPGTQLLRARDGQGRLHSKPWFGKDCFDANVTLLLCPLFTAAGRVAFSSPRNRVDTVAVCILTEGKDGLVALQQSRVSEADTWGPTEIPILDVAAYHFVLEGGDWIPQDIRIELPTQGADLRVDFEATRGQELRVTVMDTGGVPISGALASASWGDTSNSNQTEDLTDSTGTAILRGCRPGTVWVYAQARSYRQGQQGPIQVTEDHNDTLMFNLQRAGRIKGTCTHDGKGLSEFELVYWQGDPYATMTRAHFSGRQNGEFDVEDAPVGEVQIMASSPEYPRCEPQTIDVSPEGETNVVLELPSARFGVGSVMDLETGEPLLQATLQIYTNRGINLLTKYGPLHHVDQHGAFRIPGFAEGTNGMVVSCEGYAMQVRLAHGNGSAEVDFGLIPLVRTQVLTVRLLAQEEGTDFSGFSVSGQGSDNLDVLRFSGEGTATYAAIGPGHYFLSVTNSEGFYELVGAILDPHGPWLLEVPIRTNKSLELEVVLPAGLETQGQLYAELRLPGSQGRAMRMYESLGADNTARFDGVHGDHCVARVYDAGRLLAAERLEIAKNENHYSLEVDNRVAQFSVVNAHGEPLEGVVVSVAYPGDDTGWIESGDTDKYGDCKMSGLPIAQLVVHLYSPAHGRKNDILVDVPDADSSAKLILDAVAMMRIRLVDGSTPLPGVNLKLLTMTSFICFGPFATDASGWVSWGPVAEETLTVSVDHPGYWPTKVKVQTTKGDQYTDVQVRRCGSVGFQCKRLIGGPARDVAIHLRSVEFDADVSDWVAAGLVKAPSSLLSDAEGLCRIDGLPRGSYRWTARSPSGIEQSGELTVAPKALVSQSLLLD
jgi:hypothetical protein